MLLHCLPILFFRFLSLRSLYIFVASLCDFLIAVVYSGLRTVQVMQNTYAGTSFSGRSLFWYALSRFDCLLMMLFSALNLTVPHNIRFAHICTLINWPVLDRHLCFWKLGLMLHLMFATFEYIATECLRYQSCLTIWVIICTNRHYY